MALEPVFAPLAERGLAQTVLRIERAVDLLLERPFLGPDVHRPMRTGLRKMTVAPYVVFYCVTDDKLQIVRVLHSSRDLDEELPVD
ncbi:MAG: type II toxin-antitoxin system RelE/ParE family toxin [Pseudaminobacter sp.]|nr:type II toxin-antitoxin system RelE/ParE family toxin [Pseudaminobacter sp.]